MSPLSQTNRPKRKVFFESYIILLGGAALLHDIFVLSLDEQSPNEVHQALLRTLEGHQRQILGTLTGTS